MQGNTSVGLHKRPLLSRKSQDLTKVLDALYYCETFLVTRVGGNIGESFKDSFRTPLLFCVMNIYFFCPA